MTIDNVDIAVFFFASHVLFTCNYNTYGLWPTGYNFCYNRLFSHIDYCIALCLILLLINTINIISRQ